MKNLRFLFIGAIAGGAFGAKIGAFLSTISAAPISSEWIEAGFLFGLLAGSATIAVFRIAFAVVGYQSQSTSYSSNRLANA